MGILTGMLFRTAMRGWSTSEMNTRTMSQMAGIALAVNILSLIFMLGILLFYMIFVSMTITTASPEDMAGIYLSLTFTGIAILVSLGASGTAAFLGHQKIYMPLKMGQANRSIRNNCIIVMLLTMFAGTTMGGIPSLIYLLLVIRLWDAHDRTSGYRKPQSISSYDLPKYNRPLTHANDTPYQEGTKVRRPAVPVKGPAVPVKGPAVKSEMPSDDEDGEYLRPPA